MSTRKQYIPIGTKIARLAKNHLELAKVMQLTPQSISAKLRGKVVVTLRDLETLSSHYDVPLIYFVGPESMTPELARKFAKALAGPFDFQDFQVIVEVMACLPPSFGHQLFGTAKVILETHWEQKFEDCSTLKD